jgi:hypothetical protein
MNGTLREFVAGHFWLKINPSRIFNNLAESESK